MAQVRLHTKVGEDQTGKWCFVERIGSASAGIVAAGSALRL